MIWQYWRQNFAPVALGVSLLSGLLIASTSEATSRQCGALFRGEAFTAENTTAIEGVEGRVRMARALVRSGLEDFAYIAKWRLKRDADAGPYPRQGEFLSVGVPRDKFAAWKREIGEKTIGIGFDGTPADPGSASLRVGNQYYSFSAIQQGRGPSPVSVSQRVEATFYVTPAEMRAVVEFLEARGRGEIVAARDIRGGPRAGEPIRPSFDYNSANLVQESCAGACTSFASPLWLQHYAGARILENLRERLVLYSQQAARGTVWRHARVPNLMAITQFDVAANTNFIETNRWGTLRSIPVYSHIPDPPTGSSSALTARRIPLADYLQSQR
ncbi:MAG TPA: hypothetical protein PLZ57_12540 [Pseudobdellovibrionaceae bacterium]|nr:hypothetical protein [Pseudobdellovibrionaceae bacterium]